MSQKFYVSGENRSEFGGMEVKGRDKIETMIS